MVSNRLDLVPRRPRLDLVRLHPSGSQRLASQHLVRPLAAGNLNLYMKLSLLLLILVLMNRPTLLEATAVHAH